MGDNLVHEIVPEDTVPKLKGKEAKRRLEVKLFKRDKKTTWYGDIVKPGPISKPKTTAPAVTNTLLNPLSEEEFAKLPTPLVALVIVLAHIVRQDQFLRLLLNNRQV